MTIIDWSIPVTFHDLPGILLWITILAVSAENETC